MTSRTAFVGLANASSSEIRQVSPAAWAGVARDSRSTLSAPAVTTADAPAEQWQSEQGRGQ